MSPLPERMCRLHFLIMIIKTILFRLGDQWACLSLRRMVVSLSPYLNRLTRSFNISQQALYDIFHTCSIISYTRAD